jgi:serine phosphatase RsbU (regulator of sigma subunit)
MRAALLILFNFFIFLSFFAIEKPFLDSIGKLPVKERVKVVLEKYKVDASQELYSLALTEISKAKVDLQYELSILNAFKSFEFYDINRDSVYFYLQKVDLNTEPDGIIELRKKYNRSKGLCEMFDANYDISISCFHNNIELSKSVNDEDALQMSYADAALPHYYSGNFLEAINYWKLSMALSEKMSDFNTAYGTSLNIALAYAQIGSVDSARYYKDKCLSIGDKEGVALMKSTLFLNSGVIEFKNKDYQEAIKLFKKSTQFCIKEGDSKVYAKAISNISSCYLELGEPEKSKQFFEEALFMVKEAKEHKFIYSLYKLLGQANFETAQYKEAYLYLDSSYHLKDSVLNETKLNQLAELQEKYESVEKDKKIVESELAYKVEKTAKEKQQLETELQKEQKIYLFVGLGLLALFGVFMFNRFKVTKKQNKIIEQQKAEVEGQKSKIEHQHFELGETHREISDSIRYAEKLQEAILPAREDLISNLGDGFVLFKPKDVVSGDFYWTQKLENKVLFAAADCTGHGVPGALVSVVCSNALNRSVKEFNLESPSEILDKTRELVIETFGRGGKEVKDGMDIALCSIEGNKLFYSGANNPMWIVRERANLTEDELSNCKDYTENHCLIDFRPDRRPIGLYTDMGDFTQYEVQLYKNDSIYIFTDGFADQFGGVKGKKLKYKPFKEMLLQLATQSMDTQRSILDDKFTEWKGDFDQVDDVCVIGVRI